MNETPVPATTLSVGDQFVWENTESTRAHLMVGENHMLLVYRVIDVNSDSNFVRYHLVGDENQRYYMAVNATTRVFVVEPASASETPETPLADWERELIASGSVFEEGTHVQFTPDLSANTGSEDANGRIDVGVVTRVIDRARPTLGYHINVTVPGRETSPIQIHRWHDYGNERVAPAPAVPESTPVVQPEPSTIIPRTAEAAQTMIEHLRGLTALVPDAAEMIQSLEKIAKYLPGGELNQRGDQLARRVDLCGEYEAITCPTFGWTPRNGEGSSLMRQTAIWRRSLEQFERYNSAMSAADLLARYATVYDRGEAANRAVVQHAAAHLERHERSDVNELLEELDWDTIQDPEREYRVTVRLTRTRTIQEQQHVSYVVIATDEDAARDYVETNVVMDDHSNDYDWTEYDSDISSTEEAWEDCTVREA